MIFRPEPKRVSLPNAAVRRRIRRVHETATKSPDVELVTSIRQGDSTAETALYEKYSSRVYFLALSELHSREDAEDVRAETFLRVLQALRQDQLRSPESLGSFIVGIALNVIREQIRQGRRTQSLDDSELNLAGGKSLESAFIDSEASQALEEAVRRLKPREREFLRMHYYEEMTKEEISRALGIKEERLRLIKSRALKKFREVYKRLAKG
jgi:RNA polymerase sigma-70 factor, ECF subfamily